LIKKAIDILKKSKTLFVLTGADGLWKNYSATDLATPEAFMRNPKLVWEWYHWRQGIILKAQPNPAHFALAEIEKRMEKFLLLTQNVDNLHRRAGSKNILELHGNIFRARCLDCGKIAEHKSSEASLLSHCEKQDSSPVIARDEVPKQSQKDQANRLPTCPCGGLLRPDVVWFGEQIPQDIWQTSLLFLSQSDAAIICGTSGVVWPAAAIPEIAKRSGTKTIEINLEPTPVTNIVDVSILGRAGEILPQIVRQLSTT
jgi:NAD-dependent deacetylase